MILGTPIEALDKRVATPMPLILCSIPQEWLTTTHRDNNESDDRFEGNEEEF